MDTSTAVVLQPVFSVIWDILAAVLPILLSGLAVWGLRKFLNIKLDDSTRTALQSAITNAANYGLGKARGATENITIDIHNAAIATAMNYVLRSMPDALNRFGITPEQLAQMVDAKLQAILLDNGNDMISQLPSQPVTTPVATTPVPTSTPAT